MSIFQQLKDIYNEVSFSLVVKHAHAYVQVGPIIDNVVTIESSGLPDDRMVELGYTQRDFGGAVMQWSRSARIRSVNDLHEIADFIAFTAGINPDKLIEQRGESELDPVYFVQNDEYGVNIYEL